MKQNTLVQFDFDKTLGYAKDVQQEGSKAIFTPDMGVKGDMTEVIVDGTRHEIHYDGSTHFLIARDCLSHVPGQNVEMDNSKVKDDPVVKKAVERWANNVSELVSSIPIKVYQGVPELLTELTEKAYLGLLTGNPRVLGPVLLEGAGLTKFFPSEVQEYGDDNLFESKGRPGGIYELLQKAEDHYKVKFDTVIYMGDSVKDIRSAREAKKLVPVTMYSAGVCHAGGMTVKDLLHERATFWFEDFEDPKKAASELLFTDRLTIELPENTDFRERLERKLGEYKDRMASRIGLYDSPEKIQMIEQSEVFKDLLYKSMISERLINDGEANFSRLFRELWDKEEKGFCLESFKNACNVLGAYMKGKQTEGGIQF